MGWLRRLSYRAIPLAWLKRERTDLLNYKFEVLHRPLCSARDAELRHIQDCLDDSLRILEERRDWERKS